MSKECSVKICGITSVHDAQLAADAGADYVSAYWLMSLCPNEPDPLPKPPKSQNRVQSLRSFYSTTAQHPISKRSCHRFSRIAVQLLGQEPPATG